jgi:HD-GYP domain-containing protein (c-di-GMP phosphodiesterase class II)
MIEELLKDILLNSPKQNIHTPTEQTFIETILDNIYQYLYKSGQPVHTIAIGILRNTTFDMYYKGRILEKFAEMFGAMSYDTTIAGRACELYKKKGKQYLHLYSQKKIYDEFTLASQELHKKGLKEEAEALKNRAKATIDQGVGSFLLIPLSYGQEINGIFTISSLKEETKDNIMGENIEHTFIPIAQMLSLILHMEKISYDKAEEMARLLISSIDGKDEYQATHSQGVRAMIDLFIEELSRDKELRERVEALGFKLTVDRIEKLRLAALLHDMGKVFIPSKILRKSSLNSEEMLIRKMHSYCTYNMLTKSKTLKDIAHTASMHHARYYIPFDPKDLDPYEQVETKCIGYPFDRLGQNQFVPESQIIALADTFNAIVRYRPDGKGLTVSQAIDIIGKDDHKFHSGLKDIFLTIVKRAEDNLAKGKYPPRQAEEYCRNCFCLEEQEHTGEIKDPSWSKMYQFLNKNTFNNLGVISLIESDKIPNLPKQNTKLSNKKIHYTTLPNKHVVLAVRNIPKENGFIWLNKIYHHLKKHHFTGKIAFAFIGKRGHPADIPKIYETLENGLTQITNEPVHYYLAPQMYKIS